VPTTRWEFGIKIELYKRTD